MSSHQESKQLQGVGDNVERYTNEKGGKQSKIPYACHLLDGYSILQLARILAHGEKYYGRDNWRKISSEDHVNHALMHILADMDGDTQDEHLEHAFCRLMMAVAVRRAENVTTETLNRPLQEG